MEVVSVDVAIQIQSIGTERVVERANSRSMKLINQLSDLAMTSI